MKTLILLVLLALSLIGCGSSECHFAYDLSGDGATYSVCKDGSVVKL